MHLPPLIPTPTFGEYLAQVNRADRAAERLATVFTPPHVLVQARDSACVPPGQTPARHAQPRAGGTASCPPPGPTLPTPAPPPPPPLTVYAPPLVLHRGVRLDVLG